MFKPAVNRQMRVLDRSFFKREETVAAARVQKLQKLQNTLKELKKANDILDQPKVWIVQPHRLKSDEPSQETKSILLRPGIKYEDRNTWSETVNRLVDAGDIDLIPHKLQLSYENFERYAILASILPEEVLDNFPESYNHAGHVAHLTLREEYLPYKYLIGEVFLDKSYGIATVINKVEALDDDDEDNVFRLLKYELLAGEDKLQVEAREEGAVYHFDYSKVFWNSKLGHEHVRLASKFQPGEAVCDVMAGVGPFAMQAAKRNVFVWANDLNPYCYPALQESISLNKAHQFVRAFSYDGHLFIPSAARALLQTNHVARIPHRIPRSEIKARNLKGPDLYTKVVQPKTFNHYIMNLPRTAMDFLPDFIGLYTDCEDYFAPNTATKLPMIHCYCFVQGERLDRGDAALDAAAHKEICDRVTEKLEYEIRPGDEEVEIDFVRNVSPKKSQFCISFRLPPKVAFKKSQASPQTYRPPSGTTNRSPKLYASPNENAA